MWWRRRTPAPYQVICTFCGFAYAGPPDTVDTLHAMLTNHMKEHPMKPPDCTPNGAALTVVRDTPDPLLERIVRAAAGERSVLVRLRESNFANGVPTGIDFSTGTLTLTQSTGYGTVTSTFRVADVVLLTESVPDK